MSNMDGGARRRPAMRGIARAAVTAIVLVLAMLAATGTAQAAFGIVPDSFRVRTTDNVGDPLTQAGSHPNTTVSFAITSADDGYGNTVPSADLKDVVTDLPVGLVGNPTGAARCAMSDFNAPTGAAATACPTTSQVGTIRIVQIALPGAPEQTLLLPVFNLEPAEGQVAQFGFRYGRNNVLITARVRTESDYGITATIRNVPSGVPIFAQSLELWGVPADRAHDPQRFRPGQEQPGDEFGNPLPANISPRAFFINPSECAGPQTTNLAITSWQNPGNWVRAQAETPAVTGCDKVPFNPSLSLRPDLPAAGAPSSYRVRLGFAQNGDPVGLQASALRDAIVALPAGVVVSPSSAVGLTGCSPEQVALKSTAPVACPDSSKIGSVTITTPLLDQPLTGGVYLAQPTPQQLIRLYLVAHGSGVTVKLGGDVNPDPLSGQLTAVFVNNPQMPVSDIELVLKGGPRAPLSNPRSCGVVTASTRLTPWSSLIAATPADSFAVSGDGRGAPCPAASFSPGFMAGTTNPTAGRASTFELAFSRTDLEQDLSAIDVNLPEGLIGKIAGTNLCPAAAAAAGTCDESSRIGTVLSKAGPGVAPLELPGRAYLTGPYKGAPLGLSFVVPAVAGPFDLGLVVVRAAIFVDRRSTALRVVSDPLPTILQGIPLQIKTIKVSIDKRDFMLNPTRCTTRTIGGTIAGAQGGTAGVGTRFRSSDCGSLPFKPKLSIRVGARGFTKRDSTTPLEVTLKMPAGDANARSVRVELPDTINARLAVINRACRLQEFEAGTCSKDSSSGTAVAVTPLLRDPMRGDAYWVRNPARRLPDLMVALKGIVDVDLTGKVTIPGGRRLATTFDTVPDVPITMFKLRLVAGRQAPVGVVRNLCSADTRRRTIAKLEFQGQNGRRIRREQRIRIAGCGRASRRSTARRGSSRRSNARRGNARRGGTRRGARRASAPAGKGGR